MSIQLSIVLLTLNEAAALTTLIPAVRSELQNAAVAYEILVIDGGSTDGTQQIAVDNGATLIQQRRPGYGGALIEGLKAARGDYIITLDSDGSHPAEVITRLWQARDEAAVVVASRYVPGGDSLAPSHRKILSWTLNQIIRKVLSLPVNDASSGFRLYHRRAVQPIPFDGENFDALLEILVRMYAEGYQIKEIPLKYRARDGGRSNAHVLRFGIAYLIAITKMWKLRNSVDSADYDDRAFDSRIPMQLYWQRKRYSLIMGYLGAFAQNGAGVLDIGCGSSRIIQNLPRAVAFEYSLRKLRYLAKSNPLRVHGRTEALPFADHQFDALVHSEVLEHIPFDRVVFREMNRVLKPGGTLVVGTPDYGRIWWPMIEYVYGVLMPNAYADEHITHYTRQSLIHELAEHGFRILSYAYICGGELIVKAEKVSDLPRPSV